MLQQLESGVAQIQGQEATCILIDLVALSDKIWRPFGNDPEAPTRNRQLEKQVEEKLEELKALRAKLR